MRWDQESRGSHDWFLAIVMSAEPGCGLSSGTSLHVRVLDRFGRPQAAQTVGRKLQALIGGVGARLGENVLVEPEVCPQCESGQDSVFLVLGLLLSRIAQRAAVSAMDSKGADICA